MDYKSLLSKIRRFIITDYYHNRTIKLTCKCYKINSLIFKININDDNIQWSI